MLILDKIKCKNLQDRLDEYSQYGIVLYYLYNEKKVLSIDLINMFFSEDEEKSCISYMKIIRNITDNDIKKYENKYKEENQDNNDVNVSNRLCIKKLIDKLCNDNRIMNSKIYMNTYNYLLSH